MSDALKDLHGKVKNRREALARLFNDHKAPDGRFNLDAAQLDEVKSLTAEIDDLSTQYEGEREKQDIADRNAAALKSLTIPYNPVPFGGSGSPESDHARQVEAVKSLGEMFVESEAYKNFRPGAMGSHMYLKVEGPTAFDAIKTTMTTSAGYAPANNRTNIVVPLAVRTPVVADLIPQDPTDATLIRYLRQTTWNRNAAPVAENATKPESNIILTEVQSPVQVIATTMKVTNQQLADVPGIRAYLDNAMVDDVRFSEETQLLTGDGTGANLQGFLTTSGVLTGAAANQGDVPAAILRQITQVREITGYSEPSGVIMHPADWLDIRLMTTSTGEFLWGAPSEAGIFRMWGLPVISTTAMTQNTALLGDFRRRSHISRRMEMVVDVGYVNDDFTKNLVTLRAETRLSLEIYRPSAFSTVTNV